jgi:hypothetical protein
MPSINPNPMNANPWVGVVLIVVGILAIFGFEHYHMTQGAITFLIITTGIGILQGKYHVEAAKEATQKEIIIEQLKDSLRPGPNDDTQKTLRPTGMMPEEQDTRPDLERPPEGYPETIIRNKK